MNPKQPTPDLCVIVQSAGLMPGDQEWVLGKPEETQALSSCVTVEVPTWTTMFDLLVRMGLFPSKGQAKKNWKGPAEIPVGWSEFTGLGKWKSRLWIWNPAVVFPITSPLDHRIEVLEDLLGLVIRNGKRLAI